VQLSITTEKLMDKTLKYKSSVVVKLVSVVAIQIATLAAKKGN